MHVITNLILIQLDQDKCCGQVQCIWVADRHLLLKEMAGQTLSNTLSSDYTVDVHHNSAPVLAEIVV